MDHYFNPGPEIPGRSNGAIENVPLRPFRYKERRIESRALASSHARLPIMHQSALLVVWVGDVGLPAAHRMTKP